MADLGSSFLHDDTSSPQNALVGLDIDEQDSLFPLGSSSSSKPASPRQHALSGVIAAVSKHTPITTSSINHTGLPSGVEDARTDAWAAQFTNPSPEWDWPEHPRSAVDSTSIPSMAQASSDSGFLSFLSDSHLQDGSIDPSISVPATPTSASKTSKRPLSPRATKGTRWTEDEVNALVEAVRVHGVGNWVAILKDARFSHVLGHRQKASLNRKWNRIKSGPSDTASSSISPVDATVENKEKADKDKDTKGSVVPATPLDAEDQVLPSTLWSDHQTSDSIFNTDDAAAIPPRSPMSSVVQASLAAPESMLNLGDLDSVSSNRTDEVSTGYLNSQRWSADEVDTLNRAMSIHNGNWDTILMDPEFAMLRRRRKSALQSKWFRLRRSPSSSGVSSPIDDNSPSASAIPSAPPAPPAPSKKTSEDDATIVKSEEPSETNGCTPDTSHVFTAQPVMSDPSSSMSSSAHHAAHVLYAQAAKMNPLPRSHTSSPVPAHAYTSSTPIADHQRISSTEMHQLQDAVRLHGEGRWQAILEDMRFRPTLSRFSASDLSSIWEQMSHARARTALAAATLAKNKASAAALAASSSSSSGSSAALSTVPVVGSSQTAGSTIAAARASASTALLLAHMREAVLRHGEDRWDSVRSDPVFRHTLARYSPVQLSEQWLRIKARHRQVQQGHQRGSCMVTPDEMQTLQQAVIAHGEGKWTHILADPKFAPGLQRFNAHVLEQIWRKFLANQMAQQQRHQQQMASQRMSGLSAEMAQVVSANVRSKSGPTFSPEEVAKLHLAVFTLGEGNWEKILNDPEFGPSFRANGRTPEDLAMLWRWIYESMKQPKRMPLARTSESESIEVKMLRQGVAVYGEGNWKKIKDDPRFAPVLCKYDVDVLCSTWRAYLKAVQQRGTSSHSSEFISNEELQALGRAVNMYGENNWNSIRLDPHFAPLLGHRGSEWLDRAWAFGKRELHKQMKFRQQQQQHFQQQQQQKHHQQMHHHSYPSSEAAVRASVASEVVSNPAESTSTPSDHEIQKHGKLKDAIDEENLKRVLMKLSQSSDEAAATGTGGGGQTSDDSTSLEPAGELKKNNASKRWTDVEVTKLKAAVDLHGEGNWKSILDDKQFEDHLSNRGVQSLQRKWQRLVRENHDESSRKRSSPSSPSSPEDADARTTKCSRQSDASGGVPCQSVPTPRTTASMWSSDQSWMSDSDAGRLFQAASIKPTCAIEYRCKALALALLRDPCTTDVNDVVSALDTADNASSSSSSDIDRCLLRVATDGTCIPQDADGSTASLEVDSNDAIELVAQAISHLSRGQYRLCIASCDSALKIDSRCLAALCCRGQALLPLAASSESASEANTVLAELLSDVHSVLTINATCEPALSLLNEVTQYLRSPLRNKATTSSSSSAASCIVAEGSDSAAAETSPPTD